MKINMILTPYPNISQVLLLQKCSEAIESDLLNKMQLWLSDGQAMDGVMVESFKVGFGCVMVVSCIVVSVECLLMLW